MVDNTAMMAVVRSIRRSTRWLIPAIVLVCMFVPRYGEGGAALGQVPESSANLDPSRPLYAISMRVRPDDPVVTGTLSASFTPDLGTDRLVLRLWPNSARASSGQPSLTVADVTIEGLAAAPSYPNPTTAVFMTPTPIVSGTTVHLTLTWTLRAPGVQRDRISRSGGSIRLGSFLPLLAWEPGVGWNFTPPTRNGAEASMFPAADFAVTIDAGTYDVLATGERDNDGVWRATGVRDFALSVGRFVTATAMAHAPNPVKVTVGATATLAKTEAPQAYLRRIVASLEAHSRRFGPYPWPAYSVAITPHLGGGIEYPMHVMQGPGSIGRTTSHEVGHQWFYALVGNDQGRDPWLDEGLASWAEARFEGSLGWFSQRLVPEVARGQAGRPMTFWAGVYSAYYRGVYVQPVQALRELGTPEAVDAALRNYVAQYAYRVAKPSDLTAVLLQAFPKGAPVLAKYGLLPRR